MIATALGPKNETRKSKAYYFDLRDSDVFFQPGQGPGDTTLLQCNLGRSEACQLERGKFILDPIAHETAASINFTIPADADQH